MSELPFQSALCIADPGARADCAALCADTKPYAHATRAAQRSQRAVAAGSSRKRSVGSGCQGHFVIFMSGLLATMFMLSLLTNERARKGKHDTLEFVIDHTMHYRIVSTNKERNQNSKIHNITKHVSMLYFHNFDNIRLTNQSNYHRAVAVAAAAAVSFCVVILLYTAAAVAAAAAAAAAALALAAAAAAAVAAAAAAAAASAAAADCCFLFIVCCCSLLVAGPRLHAPQNAITNHVIDLFFFYCPATHQQD